MKNQLARPIHLIALIAILAPVVWIGCALPSFGQAPDPEAELAYMLSQEFRLGGLEPYGGGRMMLVSSGSGNQCRNIPLLQQRLTRLFAPGTYTVLNGYDSGNGDPADWVMAVVKIGERPRPGSRNAPYVRLLTFTTDPSISIACAQSGLPGGPGENGGNGGSAFQVTPSGFGPAFAIAVGGMGGDGGPGAPALAPGNGGEAGSGFVTIQGESSSGIAGGGKGGVGGNSFDMAFPGGTGGDGGIGFLMASPFRLPGDRGPSRRIGAYEACGGDGGKGGDGANGAGPIAGFGGTSPGGPGGNASGALCSVSDLIMTGGPPPWSFSSGRVNAEAGWGGNGGLGGSILGPGFGNGQVGGAGGDGNDAIARWITRERVGVWGVSAFGGDGGDGGKGGDGAGGGVGATGGAGGDGGDGLMIASRVGDDVGSYGAAPGDWGEGGPGGTPGGTKGADGDGGEWQDVLVGR